MVRPAPSIAPTCARAHLVGGTELDRSPFICNILELTVHHDRPPLRAKCLRNLSRSGGWSRVAKSGDTHPAAGPDQRSSGLRDWLPNEYRFGCEPANRKEESKYLSKGIYLKKPESHATDSGFIIMLSVGTRVFPNLRS
jgi:hypothetical protein